MRAAVALILLLLPAAPEADPAELYQEALYRQKILGDVEGAVELLHRVATPEAPAAVRAPATLQLVRCLRILGEVEEAAATLDGLAADAELLSEPGVREGVEAIRPDLANAVRQLANERRIETLQREALAATERQKQEYLVEIRRLEAENRRLQAQRNPASDGESAPPTEATTEDHERIFAELQEARRRAVELLDLARRHEENKEYDRAYGILLMARDADPENRSVAEALRAIRGRAAYPGARNPRQMVELEQEIRREMVPRHVDQLYDEARRRLAAGDHDGAAEIFGAILQLRLENPELAVVLLDRVEESRRLLTECIGRGARPSFLRFLEADRGPDAWIKDLERVVDGVNDAGAEHRLHSLANLMRREELTTRPRSETTGRMRAVRPGSFPVRALVELLRFEVAPGTWDGSRRFVRRVGESRLVVRHAPTSLRAVDGILAALARERTESRRLSFEVAVLSTRQLADLTATLAVSFRECGGATCAVLERADRRVWRRFVHGTRHRGSASLVAPIGRPARLDATRAVNAIVGHEESVVGGRAVSMPRVRPEPIGLRIDALALETEDGETPLGIEGEVSVLVGPFEVRSADEEPLRLPAVLRQRFALATRIPEGGALLLTGLASPFEPRREGDVACVIVLPGGAAPLDDPTEEREGVRIEELSAGEDFPGQDFEMARFAAGPGQPLTAVELIREAHRGKGIDFEERDGHLVAAGEKAAESRRALWAVLGRRRELIEITARAVPVAEPLRTDAPAIEVTPADGIRAWRCDESPLPADSEGRLRVNRVVASSLQRTNLSRVESTTHVQQYEPDPASPVPAPRPVLGRVETGLVVDVRAFPVGPDVLLSVLVKTARVESVVDESFDLGTGPLPVTVPIQKVRQARVLVRLRPGRRVVLADVPDPFGDGTTTLAIEISARRLAK